MTTTANIDFFGIEISLSSDGYPGDVLPLLERALEWIKKSAEKHKLSLYQAAVLHLADNGIFDKYGSTYQLNHYGNPNHVYSISKDGYKQDS